MASVSSRRRAREGRPTKPQQKQRQTPNNAPVKMGGGANQNKPQTTTIAKLLAVANKNKTQHDHSAFSSNTEKKIGLSAATAAEHSPQSRQKKTNRPLHSTHLTPSPPLLSPPTRRCLRPENPCMLHPSSRHWPSLQTPLTVVQTRSKSSTHLHDTLDRLHPTGSARTQPNPIQSNHHAIIPQTR